MGEILTATLSGFGHDAASLQASRRIRSPSVMMKLLCSAIGINMSVGTIPRFAHSQRARAALLALPARWRSNPEEFTQADDFLRLVVQQEIALFESGLQVRLQFAPLSQAGTEFRREKAQFPAHF